MEKASVLRWIVRVLGISLAVLPAAFLALRAYSAYRFASADRRLHEKLGSAIGYVMEKVPDDQNAAIALWAGADALTLSNENKAFLSNLQESEHWTDQQRAELGEILAANGHGLELLHRAAELKRSNFNLSFFDIPEIMTVNRTHSPFPFVSFLTAQRLLSFEARTFLQRGDWPQFLISVNSMAATTAALQREVKESPQMLGIVLEMYLLNETLAAAADPLCSTSTIKSLVSLLPDTDLQLAWKRTLAAEKERYDQMWVFFAERPNDWRSPTRRAICSMPKSIFRAQEYESLLDFVDAMSLPYGSNPPWVATGELMMSTSPLNVFRSLPAHNHMSQVGRLQTLMSLRRLARLVLNLRLAELDSGEYPATLSSFPAASEPDPFTGKTLSYQRKADGSAQITVSGAAELYKKLTHNSRIKCPFNWELPAPLVHVSRPNR